jgi:hypothetical protein
MLPENNLNDQHRKLPEAIRPFFWSYRFGNLDLHDDKKTIIVQLMNHGSLAHWRWLVSEYGIPEIRCVLQSIPATEIKPRTRELASLIFSISNWRHAHRGAN